MKHHLSCCSLLFLYFTNLSLQHLCSGMIRLELVWETMNGRMLSPPEKPPSPGSVYLASLCKEGVYFIWCFPGSLRKQSSGAHPTQSIPGKTPLSIHSLILFHLSIISRFLKKGILISFHPPRHLKQFWTLNSTINAFYMSQYLIFI